MKTEKQTQAREKRTAAHEAQLRRKAETHRKIIEGGYVDSILGIQGDDISIEERLSEIGRLINLGLVADDMAGRKLTPHVLKLFFKSQNERGNFFTRFCDRWS